MRSLKFLHLHKDICDETPQNLIRSFCLVSGTLLPQSGSRACTRRFSFVSWSFRRDAGLSRSEVTCLPSSHSSRVNDYVAFSHAFSERSAYQGLARLARRNRVPKSPQRLFSGHQRLLGLGRWILSHSHSNANVGAASIHFLSDDGSVSRSGDTKSHLRKTTRAWPLERSRFHLNLQILAPANDRSALLIFGHRSWCHDDLRNRLSGVGIDDHTIDQPTCARCGIYVFNRRKRRLRVCRNTENGANGDGQ